MSIFAPARQLIGGSWRTIGKRYGGRHGRTIKRWVEQGILPPPDTTIQERPYYYEETLDNHDRQQASAAMSKPRRASPQPSSRNTPTT